jgi:hypothetical protein
MKVVARALQCLIGLTVSSLPVLAFTPSRNHAVGRCQYTSTTPRFSNDNGWTSDFDDFVIDDDDDDDSVDMAQLFAQRTDTPADDADSLNFAQLVAQRAGPPDYTATQTRQFSLGSDLILSDYIGKMGFDEVTDWEYYYPDEDDPSERKVVQPPPFDPSKPKRTRQSSGSVVRVFRGEFVGPLGAGLSSQGLDRRILVKEFSGTLALSLAQSELVSAGKLQSEFVANDRAAKKGGWIQTASARSVSFRQDNANVAILVKRLAVSPFLGILGEVNLEEVEMLPNEFYRALGVPPPKADAIWVVYEYAGLSTVQNYAEPAQVRRSKIKPTKGFFGSIVGPPQLPPWNERAKYIVNGILKQAIEAVATIHESGVVHRSIGRSSVLLSSKAMDKTEAVSVYATLTSQLRVKLADFGFSGLYQEATSDEEFCSRARTFGLSFRKGDNNLATANFAIAEDMHALGFVLMALLLTSLAELPDPSYQMPPTDEDTLQRLLGEIFDKDMDQFREYVEAEDIWSNLVTLLDENDRAGWKVLETLLLAREKAAKNKDTTQIFTIRGLLTSPLFK